MRVLLVVPKFNYPTPHARGDLIPQGVAYVAGALEAAGHQVFGCNISYMLTSLNSRGLLHRTLERRIAEYDPHIIAVGGLSADYVFIADAVAYSRRLAPHIPIVIGGGIVTADPAFIMADLRPDYTISGDAEIPIVHLLAALENGSPLDSILNLAYWRNGVPVFNPLEKESKRIRDYALPSYDPIDIEGYFLASSHRSASHLTSYHPRPRPLPVSAGRSCPFSCSFCFHSNGHIYKQRNIQDVLSEMQHFHKKYRNNFFIIYDELFSVKESRLREFCDGFKALKLGDVRWTCALRVPDVNPDILAHMKDAGCAVIGFGLESASNTVLHSMRKKITKEQMRRALDLTSTAGIGWNGNFIFGDVCETTETMDETVDFFREYSRNCVNVGYIMPFPSTPIFDEAMRRGLIKSKSLYYSTVNTYAMYNVTKVPSPQYQEKIRAVLDEIRRLYRDGWVRGKVVMTTQPGRLGTDDHQRHAACFLVECSHCGDSHEYMLDVPMNVVDARASDGEARQDLTTLLNQPVDLMCRTCHTRMVTTLAGAEVVDVALPLGSIPLYSDLLALAAEADSREKLPGVSTAATAVGG
ncbi:radical SAM protein [Azospirillum brasilense]|uniref:B12-binding domain-containing radical SAM protein n=1 Tax=Azospirillum argentinense TaxID=2970906 RepID=UPI00190EDCFD|nr:cobalamin-dependent protein [Azospirillum argentinense]MBK3802348.1 radical SAM protein [Azospirillum argentinense]